MIRAKRATPSCWHSLRYFGNNDLAMGQSRVYARVQRDCENGAPEYLGRGSRWVRWANNAQGAP